MKMNRVLLSFYAAMCPIALFAAPSQQAIIPAKQATPAATQSSTDNTPAPRADVVEEPFNYVENQQFIFSMLNQSLDVPTKGFGYKNYLQASGVINVDASYWSKPYFGQGTRDRSSTSYLDLATANLNLNSQVNDWLSAHIGGLYTNGHSPSVRNFRPSRPANHQVALEDAYVNIANFNKMPVFLEVGQVFTPFGRYQRYPITQTLTQILTQTDLPAIELGYIGHNGLFATAYGLSGERKVNHANTDGFTNYGAVIGYQNFQNGTDYDVGVGYLRNMADVDAIRQIARSNGGYTRGVPAVNVYGDLYAGPFGFGARYMTATTRFNPVDYQFDHGAATLGAKPYAADFDASFKFNTRGHHSLFDILYQLTRQAHNMAATINGDNVTKLPKYRWGASYGVKLVKDLAFTLQYYHDKNYALVNGGNSKSDNVLTARISLVF